MGMRLNAACLLAIILLSGQTFAQIIIAARLVQQVRFLDPHGDQQWRQTIAGAYRSPFDLLSRIDQRMSAVYSSRIFQNAMIRALGGTENYVETRQFNLQDSSEIEARHLIGEDLVNRYFQALDANHHNSPHFNCESHGLSLNQTTLRAIETLSDLRISAGNVCQDL